VGRIRRTAASGRTESRAILDMLLEQATRPEYTVRLRREPGAVAFRDNRATIHLAPPARPSSTTRGSRTA